jgi:hypothetical protein
MTDRSTELDELAARVRTREVVEDAFPAKSFTDRLLIVDLGAGDSIPPAIENLLDDHDLRGASEVYGESDSEQSLVGPIGDTTRHHFVDVRTRGAHQSYVID